VVFWEHNIEGFQVLNKRSVFVDTSAIIASISKREAGYEYAAKAIRTLKKRGYRLVVSSYIVDEVYAAILNASKIQNAHQRIQLAFQVLESLHDKGDYTVLFVNESIEEKARQAVLNFGDKLWSITNMTSFLLMQKQKIPYFLSFDSDFNQASYHFGFFDIKPYISGT
jgi:predicted nucleic acid-binding protein